MLTDMSDGPVAAAPLHLLKPLLILCLPCLQGSSVYIKLEQEARRAQQRACNACGQAGASITCAHPG
jgi:hypothetical protein